MPRPARLPRRPPWTPGMQPALTADDSMLRVAETTKIRPQVDSSHLLTPPPSSSSLPSGTVSAPVTPTKTDLRGFGAGGFVPGTGGYAARDALSAAKGEGVGGPCPVHGYSVGRRPRQSLPPLPPSRMKGPMSPLSPTPGASMQQIQAQQMLGLRVDLAPMRPHSPIPPTSPTTPTMPTAPRPATPTTPTGRAYALNDAPDSPASVSTAATGERRPRVLNQMPIERGSVSYTDSTATSATPRPMLRPSLETLERAAAYVLHTEQYYESLTNGVWALGVGGLEGGIRRERNHKVDIKSFQLGRVIGQGAFGVVRIATERAKGRIVAIKQLRKSE